MDRRSEIGDRWLALGNWEGAVQPVCHRYLVAVSMRVMPNVAVVARGVVSDASRGGRWTLREGLVVGGEIADRTIADLLRRGDEGG